MMPSKLLEHTTRGMLSAPDITRTLTVKLGYNTLTQNLGVEFFLFENFYLSLSHLRVPFPINLFRGFSFLIA